MDTPDINELLGKVHSYERFINSKLADKTQVYREYLEVTLKQEAQSEFPELRSYYLDGNLETPPELDMFCYVLDTMAKKMGFELTERENDITSPEALRKRFNPHRHKVTM